MFVGKHQLCVSDVACQYCKCSRPPSKVNNEPGLPVMSGEGKAKAKASSESSIPTDRRFALLFQRPGDLCFLWWAAYGCPQGGVPVCIPSACLPQYLMSDRGIWWGELGDLFRSPSRFPRVSFQRLQSVRELWLRRAACVAFCAPGRRAMRSLCRYTMCTRLF